MPGQLERDPFRLNMASGKLFFGLEESGASAYRNAADFECLKHLHDRSRKHGWYTDGWARIDRTIVTVAILDETAKAVKHTLRIDLFDDRVVVGYDRFHQLVDDLDECDPNTQVFSGVSPVQLADLLPTGLNPNW